MPTEKDTTNDTDPKLPTVEPAQESPAQDETPQQDEETVHLPAVTPPTQDATPEQPVETPEPSPHHEQIAQFASTLQTAVDHADKQAQVTSEYQDRWAWWRNWLGEFLHEVKQHVQG